MILNLTLRNLGKKEEINMSEFINIENLGVLKMDKILFESYYPILFTCLDDKGDLFLSLCCQANRDGKKWLITKTTPRSIIKILTNEITLREAFTQYKSIQYTIFSSVEGTKIIANNFEDWDYNSSSCLPDKGEYIDAEEGEFDEEISYYTKQISNNFKSIEAIKVTLTSLDEVLINNKVEVRIKEEHLIDTKITKNIFNSLVKNIIIKTTSDYKFDYSNILDSLIKVKNNFTKDDQSSFGIQEYVLNQKETETRNNAA